MWLRLPLILYGVWGTGRGFRLLYYRSWGRFFAFVLIYLLYFFNLFAISSLPVLLLFYPMLIFLYSPVSISIMYHSKLNYMLRRLLGRDSPERCDIVYLRWRNWVLLSVLDEILYGSPINGGAGYDPQAKKRICFFTVQSLKLPEDELWYLVAHEAAHHLLNHTAPEVQPPRWGKILLFPLFNKYSREQEMDADRLAVELLARRNLPVEGAEKLMRRFEREEGRGPLKWINDILERIIGTHPPTSVRKRKIKEIIKEVKRRKRLAY